MKQIPFGAPIAVLDAPSNLGLMPPRPGCQPGVRSMPVALRARNLLARLGAQDAGCVSAPSYSFEIDPETQVRNADAIASYTRQLADAIRPLLTRGSFPIVLGGDCSILLGSALALKRKGRYGLVFIDGHQDLLTPKTSRSKGAAGMDLALACGIGPGLLTDYDGFSPLVNPDDTLLLGDRSGDSEYPDENVGALRESMFRVDLEHWRTRGIIAVLQQGLSRLQQRGIQQVWIHVDLDVLDHAIMPAVDSPQLDGLKWSEFHDALVTLLTSGMAAGMHLTIFDPDQDHQGRYAETIVAALEHAFHSARAGSLTRVAGDAGLGVLPKSEYGEAPHA